MSKLKLFIVIPLILIGLLFTFPLIPLYAGIALGIILSKRVPTVMSKAVLWAVVGILSVYGEVVVFRAFPASSPKTSQSSATSTSINQVIEQTTPTAIFSDTPTAAPEATEKQVAGVATSQEPVVTAPKPVATNQAVKVTRVIDGDTVEIEGRQRVRFIGINTPELGSSRTDPECFALAATQKTKELLEGQLVRLEKDVSETDKYGRLLRYIYKGDTFINALLVAEGYANVATYPPDVKYKDVFIAAERTAREQNLGLWGACNQTAETAPVTPKQTTPAPVVQTTPQANSGSYTCNCEKTCTQISSCAEAQYQLNTCGCNQRDSDKDGIACDGAPLNCQN